MREFFLRWRVKRLISRGMYNKAFLLMWVQMPDGCPTCGADEMHGDYWWNIDPVALRFGNQAPGQQRNPAAPDCWRLDLTDEHQLQKKAFV